MANQQPTTQQEHTTNQPYCQDLSHWCHNQSSYHAAYTTDQLWMEPDPQNVTIAISVLGNHTTDWQVAA